MNIKIKGKKAYFTGETVKPDIVFNCGQAFRFNEKNGVYFGVAYKKPLYVREQDDGFCIYPTCGEDVDAIWKGYFAAEKDYCKIEQTLISDAVVKKALHDCEGMRLLVQEPFETVITFIISANNNIKRIKGIIENLCRLAGEPLSSGGGSCYAFPTPKALSKLTVQQLMACGAGYRAEYIAQTSAAIANGFDLEALRMTGYQEARKELMTLKGIGPKVADCILLFAYDRQEAFPRDVWIKRVLQKLYGFDPKDDSELLKFAVDHFGGYGGIAQQYLFHYARTEKLL